MLFCFVLALSNFFSQTSAILGDTSIMIRNEDSSEGFIGLNDPTPFYDSLLPAANDPGISDNILDMAGSVADYDDLDRSWTDNGEAILGFPPNPLTPQSADLLAFHAGDYPPNGWGDCEFPKMPACCEYSLRGVFCIWYFAGAQICPKHPNGYYFPRGPKEQDKYRAVCCDRIKDGVGIGCVPVTGRDEEVGIDDLYPDDDGVDDVFPGGARLFNNLHINPDPSTCKSPYRRDEQIEPVCLLPER